MHIGNRQKMDRPLLPTVYAICERTGKKPCDENEKRKLEIDPDVF